MKLINKKFTSKDVKLLSKEDVFKGFFKMVRFTVSHKLFAGGWSQPITRELLERGDCVGVLLYDPVNKLIGLVEQFRIGALDQEDGPWLYEVVAGMVEPGQTLESVAHREVEEEAGIKNSKLMPICDYWVSPGGTSERMYLYCALTDLTGCSGNFGLEHEAEDILLHVLPQSDVFEWFGQGQFNNAATTISLMWLRANCDHIDESVH